MIPIKLTLSGFLSYKEEAVLDFTTFEIACIAGANGAGKSSILDAITWVLFGRARKRDDSLINMHPDTMAAIVELVFAYENNLYRVQRSNPRGRKSTVLEFQIAQKSGENGQLLKLNGQKWKPLTERTGRLTQQRIEETLRLDYETFVNAAFFLQGNADEFTKQTAGKRKAILANILGLEIWEDYRQQTVQKRKSHELEIQGIDGRLAEINAELNEESDRKARLKELKDDLARIEKQRVAQETALENMRKNAAILDEQARLVENLNAQREAAARRVKELELRRGDRSRERDTYSQTLSRAPEIRKQYSALEETRLRLKEWDDTAKQFEKHDRRRHKPITEIAQSRASLEAERTFLLDEQRKARKAETEGTAANDQLLVVRKEFSETEIALAEKSVIEEKLQEAREGQTRAATENPRLKAEMDDLKGRIDQLKDAPEDAALCPLCGQPLAPDERQRLIDELQAEGKEKGDRYRANRDVLSQANDLVKKLQAEFAVFKPLEANHRNQTAKLTSYEHQIDGFNKQITEWGQKHEPRLTEIQTLFKEENFAPEARAKLDEINAELKEIGYDAAEHDRVRRAVEEGATLENEIRILERAEAALEPLEREIKDLDTQLENYQKDQEKLEGEYINAAAALAAAQASSPDLRTAELDLMDMQDQENEVRMKIGGAQQRVSVLDDLRVRKKALALERSALAEQVSRYNTLERAFGKNGVPALLIEQALPQIESKANELLDRLSGGGMTVRFQTQRELKSREDLRETLDIQISDAAGIRDYEMYSGGEAFRVNFAVRLALSEVLSQRAGARLQTLVIDEGFGSQDAAGRQRLIEAINMVRPDFEKILVITHIDELKDAFPTQIQVNKTDKGSRITVV